MTDIDKYEGHYGHTRKPTPWIWYEDDGWFLVVRDDHSRTILEGVKAVSSTADMNLIADAPLLLAEVKRLRELMLKGSNDYTTSYTDLRDIIEEVHWALTGDDDEYTESSEARIKYALRILSEVIG